MISAPDAEYFGTEFQIDGMKKAAALWSLLKDDRRFAYYGRMVSVAGAQANAMTLALGLARLQGFASCQFFPAAGFDEAVPVIAAEGLDPSRWEQFWGRETALRASADILSEYLPPEGLEMREVGPDTPADIVAGIAALSMRCGVMPAPGHVMRGHGPRGLCLYVQAPDGTLVGTGSSYMTYHAQSTLADEAFWGMLATDDAWRGRRIAGWIGAEAIRIMHERFGAAGFSTGVKADNGSSQAMCTRLGVLPSDFIYMAISDPAVLGSAPLTR